MLEVKTVSKMDAPDVGLKTASFSVFPGDIFGIIGPNGSGKSTLLGEISDRHQADSGVCLLDNQRLNEQKGKMCVLPEEPYLVEAINGIQYLRYIAGLKGMLFYEAIDNLVVFFDVNDI